MRPLTVCFPLIPVAQDLDLYSPAVALGYVSIMTGLALPPRRIAVLASLEALSGVLRRVIPLSEALLGRLHALGYQVVAVPEKQLKEARRGGLLGDEGRWVGMRIEAVSSMEDAVVLAWGV
jgi:hypothetical protein